MARVIVIILTALMMAGEILGVSCRASNVELAYEYTVKIDEPTVKQATVMNSHGGYVTFNGTVGFDRMSTERILVELMATADTGWACIISPNQMVFGSSTGQAFRVTVHVPCATRADTVGSIRVRAITFAAANIVAEANATVTIAPYYRPSLSYENSSKVILPREKTRLDFKVRNTGNSVDSYSLAIENAEELKASGWSVALDRSTVMDLPPGGMMNVAVEVRSPQDWSWAVWIDYITPTLLNVSSLGARNNNMTVAGTLPVRVIVRGTNYPLLESMTAGIMLAAVGIAAFAVFRRRRKRRMAVAGS